MATSTSDNKNKSGLFFSLFILTLFFLLLEISYFIQCNRAYLSDFTFVSDTLPIPWSIAPGVIYFLLMQLLVHFAYSLSIGGMAFAIVPQTFIHRSQKVLFIGITLWIIGIVLALAANQLFFPNSKFSELTQLFLPNRHVTYVVFIVLLFCMTIALLLAIKGCLHLTFFYVKQLNSLMRYAIIFFMLTPLGIYFYMQTAASDYHTAATPQRPNIILIGLDSLRPDFLSFFGYKNRTVFFDQWLSQASVFTDAFTPLARTFPSWTSILTGEYPKQNGVRYNLASTQHVNLASSLPALLQQQGYHTVYATDETRFSNIDSHYGFDTVITPPMGLNDFLIGTFNDFPLSNLLLNTFVGKWLFPYSYANRAVYFTYQPRSFLELLTGAFKTHSDKPLFLTVHFCLTHYPYLYANLPGNELTILERYQASVLRLDQQLSDFFTLLKHYQLLDHAIVVLLSDHGEALELVGDRITHAASFISPKQQPLPQFYPPSLDHEAVDQSAGHGTDVLALTQYRSLLAFRLYGMDNYSPKRIPNTVSLLDIKPTILQLLHLSTPQVGLSLLPLMQNRPLAFHHTQPLFLESDFTPAAIRTVYPEVRNVVLEGIQLFVIDPISTRLVVKDSMGEMIIHSKQYAALEGDWILALYPQSNHYRMPILVNRKTGQWTNDLHSEFAKHSPANSLFNALKTFYGREIS